MIYGVGVDIVKIERVEKAVKKWGKAFLERVFTEEELRYCMKEKVSYASLAARFAAKEAFIKALKGKRGLRFKEIETLNNQNGTPYLILHGNTKKIFDSTLKKGKCHLSISHDTDYAVGMVVIEEA
jgi:holo-[acyl-carrier protein] synthase